MINPFTGGLDFSQEQYLFKKESTSTSEVFGRDINENYNPVDSE